MGNTMMTKTIGHNDLIRKSWIEYIEGHLQAQSNLMWITLQNIRRMKYDDDEAVIDYIKPIFTTAIEYLLSDHYDLMEQSRDYVFSGCAVPENKSKSYSSVPTHLHLLANIRDFVIDKPVVADRLICTLLNDRPNRPVGYYVPARHKLLASSELRECFWTDEYRDKDKLFPERKGEAPIINYSIFQSDRNLNSWRASIDLRDVKPVYGFRSKDINVQIKPRQIKSLIVKEILAPYTYKNNENNRAVMTSDVFPQNISDDINRVILFKF